MFEKTGVLLGPLVVLIPKCKVVIIRTMMQARNDHRRADLTNNESFERRAIIDITVVLYEASLFLFSNITSI